MEPYMPNLCFKKRVFKTAIYDWGYGIPKNPTEKLQLPPTHKSRKRRLVGNEKERLLSAACSQKNIYIALLLNSQSRRECVVLKY